MIQNSLIAVLSTVILLAGCSQPASSKTSKNPNPTSQDAARLIDVRSPQEYNTSHLAGAINIPHDQIGQKIAQVTTNKSELLLIHCRSGGRSAIAKTTLLAGGYTNVVDLGSFDNARLVTGK